MFNLFRRKIKENIPKVQIVDVYNSKLGGFGNSDLEVWIEIDSVFKSKYQLSVEGCICYGTLTQGIEYFKELNNSYYEWLNKIFDLYVLIQQSKLNRKELLHTSHEFEIYKNKWGYEIYLEAPKFDNLIDTYYWLKETIEQIEEFSMTLEDKAEVVQ